MKIDEDSIVNSSGCKRILIIAVVLCLLIPYAYAGSKEEKPVVPVTKTRLIVLGDHWVYDINYRTPKNKNDSDEGGLASLFNIGASDNFRQTLDIRVVSFVKGDGSVNNTDPVAGPTASTDAPTTDQQSDDPASEQPNDPSANTNSQPPQPFGKNANCFTILCSLKYKKDGKDFNRVIA